MRRHLILLQRLPAMPEYNLRLRTLLQHMYHLIDPDPIIMVPCQLPLRHVLIIILLHMIHVRREDPAPGLGEIHLHDAGTGRVAGGMVHVDARCDL